jgi:hypothetical protein
MAIQQQLLNTTLPPTLLFAVAAATPRDTSASCVLAVYPTFCMPICMVAVKSSDRWWVAVSQFM